MRAMAVAVSVGLALGVVASQASCGACTEVGCVGGLQVVVKDASGQPVRAFSGEARFDGKTVAFQCDETLPGTGEFMCSSGEVFIEGPTGEVQLQMTRTGGAGSFQGTLSPEYATVSPNGPYCSPHCKGAGVEVTLR